MPTIFKVIGMKIVMYFGDHNPPHVHCKYNGDDAVVEIDKAKISKGRLPKPQKKEAIKYVKKNKKALLSTWDEFQNL
jgi:hypothetical protein